MAELDESKWFPPNPFGFEKSDNGDLFVIISDTDSEIDIIKEKLPNNSATLFLLKRLEKEGLI